MLIGTNVPEYFETPKQVYFRYPYSEEKCYIGGIAFQEDIISGVDGEVIALGDVDELNIYDDWISLSDEIIGG